MASVGQRYYTPNPFEIDVNGVPLGGAQLFFYVTGTSTPASTYSDVNLTIANTNPIIADANGRFGSIFLSPSVSYKVSLWTAVTTDNPTGTQIWTMDPVGPGAGGAQQNTAGIIGEVRVFAGPSTQTPAGWALCYGQAVSRSTYAAAFAVIGTTYGAGDGSTTFNLPDLRGRAIFGLDNMGGVAASRVTSGVSGIQGATLGGAGGDQRIPEHIHNITDPGHVHTVTDPGHVHTLSAGYNYDNAPGAGSCATSTTVFGTVTTNSAVTGISIVTASTGITVLAAPQTGTGANMPPAMMMNAIIYLGA
jgi:microcystin-dependent protein